MKSLLRYAPLLACGCLLVSCAAKHQIAEGEANARAQAILEKGHYSSEETRIDCVAALSLSEQEGKIERTGSLSVDQPNGYFHMLVSESNNGVITENETWCWKEESEEGVIYHTAYTMEGRTIFSEGEATYGLSLTAGIALYYTYLEIAYAPLRDFVSENENHLYECSNFYASEAGTLELDAKTQGASYALVFASYSPKRVNYKNFTEEGETAKTGIIQYSYAVKSFPHPTDPSPEE